MITIRNISVCELGAEKKHISKCVFSIAIPSPNVHSVFIPYQRMCTWPLSFTPEHQQANKSWVTKRNLMHVLNGLSLKTCTSKQSSVKRSQVLNHCKIEDNLRTRSIVSAKAMCLSFIEEIAWVVTSSIMQCVSVLLNAKAQASILLTLAQQIRLKVRCLQRYSMPLPNMKEL